MSFLDQFRNRKVLHVSHNDLDGIGATVLGLYYIQPIAKEFRTINSDQYDLNDEPNLDTYLKYYDIFIFTDFPLDSSLAEKINKTKKPLIVCDHHQSGNIALKNILLENYFYDITGCGTKIFLDKIAEGTRIKKVVWQAVELVNVYDLYQMKSSLWRDAKGLSNIVWGTCNWNKEVKGTTKYINFIDLMLNKFKNDSVFFFTDYEKKLVLNAEKKEQENLKEAKRNLKVRIDNQGNTYGYFECTSKQSIVSNYILSENENLKYVISHVTWGETAGNITPKVSVRSIEGRGIDCSLLCSLWSGGGHILAAGVELKNMSDFEKLREGKLHLI